MKTEEEIEASKNKEEYIAGIKMTPVSIAVIGFVSLMIIQMACDLILGKSRGRYYLPVDYVREKVTFSDIPGMLPEYFVISSVIGIFIYIFSRKFKNYKIYPDTYLCRKCYKIKSDDKNYLCECGGEFIEMDKMKWIEDK